MRGGKNSFLEIMEQFSDQVKARRLFKKAESLYLMRSYKITSISSDEAIHCYERLQGKYEAGELKVDAQDWHKNERKLFIWYLICYCDEKKVAIQDLADDEWEEMAGIFFGKSSLFLKFQGLSILKNAKRHIWTPEDDQQLKKFVEQVKSNQWNTISKQIFFASEKGRFISAKQCRERWFNHICKQINKQQWSHEQDVRILTLTIEIGKKWSQIARSLGTHRTEHMVKNRFNSIINKIRRKKMENQESLTRKALSILQKESSERKQKQIACQKKQEEIFHPEQGPQPKQRKVIEIEPKPEQKHPQQAYRKSVLKRFPSREGQGDLYNISDLPEGDFKDLKNLVSKKQKGCFSFNIDESVQLDNPEPMVFSMTPNSISMTPNSMKTISPGIPNSYFMTFDGFLNRKQDGGQLFSPAPQCYSPVGGFFSSLSPGFDVLSLIQRDKNGLNSSKQFFSSSLFTPVPSDANNNDIKPGITKKENKQMQQ